MKHVDQDSTQTAPTHHSAKRVILASGGAATKHNVCRTIAGVPTARQSLDPIAGRTTPPCAKPATWATVPTPTAPDACKTSASAPTARPSLGPIVHRAASPRARALDRPRQIRAYEGQYAGIE